MPELRPALLLDRDGVVNVEKNYVHKTADFEFIDGIFELCRTAQQAGMAVVIVTNQAGIGRGYYSEQDFHSLTDWMRAQFLERGVTIDGVYFCPFHPEHGVGDYRRDSYDRKPSPGMILRARDELALDLERSVMVGDKASDISAAKAAGVGRTVVLGSGATALAAGADFSVSSLAEARLRLFVDTTSGPVQRRP
jgi:D-glycero-D-manno-heptose 1,7-bisphosphate phosphatase